MSNYKVGFGFDVHRCTAKKKNIIICGVVIPADLGIEAVSDGDVAVHSLADALCGAAGLGDIGDFFPPGKKSSEGVKSAEIIEFVLRKVKNKRLKVNNADITVIAQKPKLQPYKKEMLFSLRKILSCKEVNIKIKSKEHLDIMGGKNSIACLSSVLLKKC